MRSFSWKQIQPHVIAVAVFLLVAIIFGRHALESNVVLKQSDTAHWLAMSKESRDYEAVHGSMPLWNTTLFSGMPAYQIALKGPFNPVAYLDGLFQLFLPQPINFFFLACVGFYFLLIVLKVRPIAAMFGALAFAYCTYSPIIISAGHVTKMLAMAYAPFVMAGVFLLLQRKYLWGFIATALFTSLQIAQGHQQVSYYLFLVLCLIVLSHLIYNWKEEGLPKLAKSVGLIIAGGLIAIAYNAITLFPTLDYAKESKRGGQLVMTANDAHGEKVVDNKTVGMSKEYAFQWSYGIDETLSLIFPGVKGYGLQYGERDGDVSIYPTLKEDAHSITALSQTINQPADQYIPSFSSNLYWGKQPFTNGPVYLGAIVCFLFLLGLYFVEGKFKWWIVAGTLLGIILALGHNFSAFNNFMFDYFPLYKNFRVPTMALIIPQWLVPLLAALALNEIASRRFSDDVAWKKFIKGCIATGIVFAIGLAVYFSSDFSTENRQRTAAFNEAIKTNSPDAITRLQAIPGEKDNQLYEGMVMNFSQGQLPNAQEAARDVVSGLKKDRAALFMGSIWRSLLYILLAAGFIALFLKNKLKELLLLIGITAFSTIDLLSMDNHYLNKSFYQTKESFDESEFPLTSADQEILKDKDPNYRVYDLSSGNPFENAKTSYYHKSIGGYHAAKLGIYDDLYTHQLIGKNNMAVLNMLNTKYIINTTPENKVAAARNPEALGNAWFVKGINFTNGPVEMMKALDNFNPKDTAVIDVSDKAAIGNIVPADSASVIKMTKFDNDAITYESNSSGAHLGVFSEIFYKDWNAYIDGNKVPVIKANYVLRALPIPAGKHNIEFKFEPKIYQASSAASQFAYWLLFVLILGALAYTFVIRKKGVKDR